MNRLLIIVYFLSSVFAFSQIQTVITLQGNVYNEITKQPISVEVQLLDETGKKINSSRSNSKDGSYLLTGLKPGQAYKIAFADRVDRDEIYIKRTIDITMPNTDKYLEMSRDFMIIPLKRNQEIPIPFAPFENGKSKLKATVDMFMNDLIDIFNKNPRVNFTISCFPDNNNDETANLTLTTERCNALKQYLTSNGITEDRFSVQPNAKTDPKKPLPVEKAAKGKKYKGSNYLIIK